MGAKGTATLDFGASYTNDATVAVTGQGGILGSSLSEAWIEPAITTDHTVDEHVMAAPILAIMTRDTSAGVGFTIQGTVSHPKGLTGKFNVGWVWS